MPDDHPTAPSDVNEETTWFDRAADTTSRFIARPPLPAILMGDLNARPGSPTIELLSRRLRSAHFVVHGHEPTRTVPTPLRRSATGEGSVLDFSHSWVDSLQLVAALVTFLMVALLENESWRGNKATQRKLNALAAAMAELMAKSDVDQEHVRQLNAAVGLEKRESSSR